MLSNIGNLDNTEQMKNLICTYPSSESYKELLTNAHNYYVKFKGLSWNKPKFVKEDKPIFVPLESELDLLISRATMKLSIFLELLKGTGADSGEAWKLRWIDINTENRTLILHQLRTIMHEHYQ